LNRAQCKAEVKLAHRFVFPVKALESFETWSELLVDFVQLTLSFVDLLPEVGADDIDFQLLHGQHLVLRAWLRAFFKKFVQTDALLYVFEHNFTAVETVLAESFLHPLQVLVFLQLNIFKSGKQTLVKHLAVDSQKLLLVAVNID
jgi:hypothetical protein